MGLFKSKFEKELEQWKKDELAADEWWRAVPQRYNAQSLCRALTYPTDHSDSAYTPTLAGIRRLYDEAKVPYTRPLYVTVESPRESGPSVLCGGFIPIDLPFAFPGYEDRDYDLRTDILLHNDEGLASLFREQNKNGTGLCNPKGRWSEMFVRQHHVQDYLSMGLPLLAIYAHYFILTPEEFKQSESYHHLGLFNLAQLLKIAENLHIKEEDAVLALALQKHPWDIRVQNRCFAADRKRRGIPEIVPMKFFPCMEIRPATEAELYRPPMKPRRYEAKREVSFTESELRIMSEALAEYLEREARAEERDAGCKVLNKIEGELSYFDETKVLQGEDYN